MGNVENTENTKELYDVIIIGSGAAGLTAAIYASRAKLNTLLIERQPMGGGQILTTYEVDNYPGLSGVSGFELGQKFADHAKKMGITPITADVKSLVLEKERKSVVTSKGEYQGKTVILATGAEHKKLKIAGEEKFAGQGVSYCATCDGAFFRGKTTAVIGGGDVALEDALFLARGCEKVYLIHRRDEFRGTRILQERVKETENIEILFDTTAEEIRGNEKAEELLIYNKKTGERKTLATDGVFIAVGMQPELSCLGENSELQTDENGYIIAGEDCRTNLFGVYAAGDIRTKQLRQVITAAADGANAVTSAEKDLL